MPVVITRAPRRSVRTVVSAADMQRYRVRVDIRVLRASAVVAMAFPVPCGARWQSHGQEREADSLCNFGYVVWFCEYWIVFGDLLELEGGELQGVYIADAVYSDALDFPFCLGGLCLLLAVV